MVKSTCDDLQGVLFPTQAEVLSGQGVNNPNYLSSDPVQGRILIGMALCFYVGIIHVRLKENENNIESLLEL